MGLSQLFRVLERYPSSGRLLRAYGRFLEWVRNEPSMAQRCYTEALRKGMGESLMALVGAGGGTGHAASFGVRSWGWTHWCSACAGAYARTLVRWTVHV